MTNEAFKRYWEARSFESFVVDLADGRSLTVSHPENIAMSRSGRTISAAAWPDGFDTIDLLLVTRLKPAPRNGRGKRRR
jgi:hypothetical protein